MGIQARTPHTESTERHDATVCEEVIRDMIDALNKGPRTRYRSLAITQLEMAAHFLHDAATKE